MKSALKKGISFGLDLLFPKNCIGCGKEGLFLCKKCLKKIVRIKTPYCPICRTMTQNGQFCRNCRPKTSLTGIMIACHYQYGPIKKVIHAFKYEGIKELKEILIDLISKRIEGNLLRGEKIILPIPLHEKRRTERGYNQSTLLAVGLSEKFSINYSTNTLIRFKRTKPQIELSKKERAINIKNAFRVKNKELIQDRTILLIDDVTTTGLTLNEAAKALKSAGARNVWGVVIAQG